MRGKPPSICFILVIDGITPAYAGKTLYYITLKSNGATEDVDMI